MVKKTPQKAENKRAHKTRKIQAPQYRSFRLSKRIKHPAAKLPSSFRIFKSACRHLWVHKRLFLGIILVYGLLNLLFVKGFGVSSGLTDLKASLEDVFSGGLGDVAGGLALFSYLVSSSASAASEAAGVYQTVLLVMVSLGVVWALRQTYAGNKITVRDTFYKSMYPLVPFLLVIVVIGLQLVPLFIGSTIHGIVVSNGLAVTGLEQIIWYLLFGMFALLTLYMLSSSLFALYIVTLADTEPLQALRSARELVRYRRWTVLRKVFLLPVFLVLSAVAIMVPLIIFSPVLAEWVFFFMSLSFLVLIHSYLYSLYRDLL